MERTTRKERMLRQAKIAKVTAERVEKGEKAIIEISSVLEEMRKGLEGKVSIVEEDPCYYEGFSEEKKHLYASPFKKLIDGYIETDKISYEDKLKDLKDYEIRLLTASGGLYELLKFRSYQLRKERDIKRQLPTCGGDERMMYVRRDIRDLRDHLKVHGDGKQYAKFREPWASIMPIAEFDYASIFDFAMWPGVKLRQGYLSEQIDKLKDKYEKAK